MENLEAGLQHSDQLENPPFESINRQWDDFFLDLHLDIPAPEFYPLTTSSVSYPTTSPLESLPLFPNSVQEVGGPSAPPVNDDTLFLGFNDAGTLNADQCNVLEQNSQPLPCQDLVIHGDENPQSLKFDLASLDQFLNWEEEIPEPIEQFPIGLQTEPLHCVGCQVLREIIHANEFQTTKLEIHGTVGKLNHAILLVQNSGDGLSGVVDQQTIDFSTSDTRIIKQFLIDYMQSRTQQGFALVNDSLSAFYDALCGGMGSTTNPNLASPTQHCQYEPEMSAGMSSQSRQHGIIGNHVTPVQPSNKSNLAAQRERTGRLQMIDLVGFFHLPITVAAKQLEICPTVLKKICRRNGMRRWPHRKIKSIDRNILSLKHTLAAQSKEEGAAAIQAEIEKLQNERAQVCVGRR